MRAALVVLAGGSGSRLAAATNKVYLPLAGRRVLSWSLLWAAQVPQIASVVLVVRPGDAALAEDTVARDGAGLDVRLVVGGRTRHGSEDAAFAELAPQVARGDLDVVAVHDGARPLSGPSMFRAAVTTAGQAGGAVPALPAPGLLPVDPAGRLQGAVPPAADGSPGSPWGTPRALVRVQTPQAFRARDLLAAYVAAGRAGFEGTDTASSVETFSDLPVRTIEGSRRNLKVTYPQDLLLAERLLAAGGAWLR